MSEFSVIEVPNRRPLRPGSKTPIFEAVVAAEGKAIRVEPTVGRTSIQERNTLQNGLSLYCGRYHQGKYRTHTRVQADGAIALWVEPK